MSRLTASLAGAFFVLAACATAAPELTAAPVVPVVQARPMQAPGMACLPRAEMLRQLALKYQEAPIAAGLTETNNIMVEVFSTSDGATWTLVITNVNGTSCVIANGFGWRTLTPGPHLGPGI